MCAWGDRETRIFLKVHAWGIMTFFETWRPVDQNSRENCDFYPQKPVKPVYFCIFRGFFDPNSLEFRDVSPRNFVKIPNFGENFPGKVYISAREFRKTRIFLHFQVSWRPKFPGIREKVAPGFSWKLEIVVDTFRGKSWILSREFWETRIFLHFCTIYWHKFPGIFVDVSPIFEILCKSFPGKNLIFTSRTPGNP